MQGVLTLAGEGTRMLPWSRGLRKEFLPLYDHGANGSAVLKPVAHLALETLAAAGADEITLVVGSRDLITAQNYFSIDRQFLRRHAHHKERLTETEKFYERLQELRLRFAIQPRPHGFGDAVLQAQHFVGAEPFLLHAADAALLEPERGAALLRMAALRDREDLDAVLLVRKVADPRRYGVIIGKPRAREGPFDCLEVTEMEEKPESPKSHWAATAVYAFSPRIFRALEVIERREHPRELELTSAIERRMEEGGRVAALVLKPRLGEWRSLGSVDGYLRALRRTEQLSHRGRAK
jgi:UTP--glucose-1-phosphate uridylyltransferase